MQTGFSPTWRQTLDGGWWTVRLGKNRKGLGIASAPTYRMPQRLGGNTVSG